MAKEDETHTYSEAEADARREATLRQMLATPHQKHKPLGKRKTAKAAKPLVPRVGESGWRGG